MNFQSFHSELYIIILFPCCFISQWLNILYFPFSPPPTKGGPTVFAFLVPKIKSCARSNTTSESQERLKLGFHVTRLSFPIGPHRVCDFCTWVTYMFCPQILQNLNCLQSKWMDENQQYSSVSPLLTRASPILRFTIQMQKTSSSYICTCLFITSSIWSWLNKSHIHNDVNHITVCWLKDHTMLSISSVYSLGKDSRTLYSQ